MKALLTAISSPTCSVREQSLLLSVRACYHVFLVARSPVNKNTAKAILRQILNVIFQRMEVAALRHAESAAAAAKTAASSAGAGPSSAASSASSGHEASNGVAAPASSPSSAVAPAPAAAAAVPAPAPADGAPDVDAAVALAAAAAVKEQVAAITAEVESDIKQAEAAEGSAPAPVEEDNVPSGPYNPFPAGVMYADVASILGFSLPEELMHARSGAASPRKSAIPEPAASPTPARTSLVPAPAASSSSSGPTSGAGAAPSAPAASALASAPAQASSSAAAPAQQSLAPGQFPQSSTSPDAADLVGFPTHFHRDAFLLFRSLCRLSMRGDEDPLLPQGASGLSQPAGQAKPAAPVLLSDEALLQDPIALQVSDPDFTFHAFDDSLYVTAV